MTTNNLYEPEEKTPSEKPVRLVVRMNEQLRDAFKAHCDKHNLDMSVVIRRFMIGELSK